MVLKPKLFTHGALLIHFQVELNYNIICYKTGAGLFFVGMYIYVNEDFLIVFAAYPSQSPVSCDGEVRSNLPAGTLYLKKTCEKVDAGGSYLFLAPEKVGS